MPLCVIGVRERLPIVAPPPCEVARRGKRVEKQDVHAEPCECGSRSPEGIEQSRGEHEDGQCDAFGSCEAGKEQCERESHRPRGAGLLELSREREEACEAQGEEEDGFEPAERMRVEDRAPKVAEGDDGT